MGTQIALLWRIVSSRAFLRLTFLFSAIILIGNGLFSIFYLQRTTGNSAEANPLQLVVTNQVNTTEIVDFSRQIVHSAPPVDDNSRFIHKLYWNIVRRNASDITDEQGIISESDRGYLKSIYDSGALWGEYRKQEVAGSVYGFDVKYDSHLILQQVWQQTALDVYPDLFKSEESKRIVIRDGFHWWGYAGGENLACSGPFNRRCKLSDSNDLSDADAVIAVRDWFHKHDFYVGRDTFRIFFIQESPIASPETRLLRRNDILASYWRGSELPARYANWVYYDPDVRSKLQKRNYAKGKKKLAAVFMSNCLTTNRRLDLAKALQEYMQVDIYGDCGDHICEREEQHLCFETLRKEYFFYLAFENANCRDYVTEKFFINALRNDVVPVVLGAHRDDYLSLAPDHSFVMVDDFNSVTGLAAELKRIASDEEAYNKYFQWKGTGEFIHSDFFCRVCSLLWYADVNPLPPRRTVFLWADETKGVNPMCLTSGKQLWRKGMHGRNDTNQ